LTLTYNIKDTKSLKKNFKKFKNTFLRQKQRHSDTKETGRRERERERERENILTEGQVDENILGEASTR
jgi:hypothetical protein